MRLPVLKLLIVLAAVVAGVGVWLLAGNEPLRASGPVLEKTLEPDKNLPRGFVVWSSNRDGDHDIYRMSLPDREISQLTSHPNADYYPRVSPDGRYVVFARSQKPNLSQRNHLNWNVILLDMNTGKEQRIAVNGNTPHWSFDGTKIYFQHEVTRFVEHDVKTGKQRVAFHSGLGQVKPGAGLQTPHASPDGEYMAVTLRFKQHLIGIVDPKGKITRISDGCQLTWNQAGQYLYYVDYGGRMKNAIFVYEPDLGTPKLWLDLPGEFSHEYFPKLSNDERYLVFGASRSEKEHEHDRADYEIFLWQVGTPLERVTRITFDPNNDNYPDVYLYD